MTSTSEVTRCILCETLFRNESNLGAELGVCPKCNKETEEMAKRLGICEYDTN
jgi:hypothetical protein